MASLPADTQMTASLLSRMGWGDDIARLKAEVQLPNLKYVDVSVQRALRRAMQRWPLLAEFDQTQQPSAERDSRARHDDTRVPA
jgi:hypothetical protein